MFITKIKTDTYTLLLVIAINYSYKKNTIMSFKDFIYNKETKVSNLLGVLYVIVVTIVTVAVVYWTTKL